MMIKNLTTITTHSDFPSNIMTCDVGNPQKRKTCDGVLRLWQVGVGRVTRFLVLRKPGYSHASV